MKINTNGATRIVIIFDKFVIKIPRFYKYCKFYGLIEIGRASCRERV